jgi:ubiquinone/menaquinone biosynthesis C-methylase UbiE
MDTVLEVVDRLNLPRRSRILDIGCGPGVITVALAQRGFRVTAVDCATEMTEATAQLAVAEKVDHLVSLSIGDVHKLPFSSNRFDLVLMIGVSEWLPALPSPVTEIARVTKPGGFTIVTTDNRWSLHALVDPLLHPFLAPVKRQFLKLLHASSPGTQPRPTTYSIREMDRAARAAGFNKLEGKSVGFGPFSFLRRFVMPDRAGVRIDRRLQRLADRSFPLVNSFGHVYLLLAAKSNLASHQQAELTLALRRIGPSKPANEYATG